MTIAILLILWLDWPQIRAKSKRDKVAFITLLLIGWLLSLLDLPNTPGPVLVLKTIFKPFRGWVE
ncbi:hypothetical protein J2T20_002646 [Paenibacillus wynnii]|nr:hypothetical protein [Paenibacillus wynnii]